MKKYTWITILVLLIFGATASAERLSVKVSVANIRSGPGKNYDTLWEVEKYYPLDVDRKSGQWYHFRDFEGDKGWIHKSLLNHVPSVITKKEECNIRSGPGAKFSIVFTVEKGVPFKVLKYKSSWIQIQHADGDKGWIHKSLVW